MPPGRVQRGRRGIGWSHLELLLDVVPMLACLAAIYPAMWVAVPSTDGSTTFAFAWVGVVGWPMLAGCLRIMTKRPILRPRWWAATWLFLGVPATAAVLTVRSDRLADWIGGLVFGLLILSPVAVWRYRRTGRLITAAGSPAPRPPATAPPAAATEGGLAGVRRASWLRRAAGFLVDGAVVVVPYGLLWNLGALAGGWLQAALTTAGALVSVGVGLCYNRWYLGGRTGQTWGRRIVGLRLVSGRTGDAVGPGRAFGRDVAHVAADSASFYVGWFVPLWDANRQTLADRLVDTVVIHHAPAGRVELRDRLNATLDAGQAGGLHAVVVVRDGQVLLEHYGTGEDFSWGTPHGVVEFGPETLHDLRSVTKSVTALLYGIALRDGRVPDPAEPLLRQFPQYSDLAADPERARLTVEHALTMSLGLEWNEDPPYDSPANAEIAMELAPDRYRYVLERPIAGPPGARWSYCGGATALLGKLVSDGTGRPLPEYAREVLFAPLGIAEFEWMAGDDGVASAASGLRLTPRDLARIGELVLAGGAWDGREVVPAGWVRTMLQPRLPTGPVGSYGLHWYLGSSAGQQWAAATGNGGQRLTVLPDLGLVVAVTAGNYDAQDQWRTPATVLEQVVLPAAGHPVA
jgi:CubicO group peptidase (beta-lactamase class C family)